MHLRLRFLLSDRGLTNAAGYRSVRRQALGPRRLSPFRELLGHMLAGPAIHLVRRLALECGVGELGVVFADIEIDKPTERLDGVEGVQVEPLVLERSPPRLYHRVRECDFRLRQDTSEDAGVDELVDRRRSVLYTRVGEDGRWLVRSGGRLAGFNENLEGHGGIKMLGNSPGENPAGEVVDDGIEVGMSTVEESDDGRVDVPNLVRPDGSDSDAWLRRVDALAWASPAMFSDKSVPRRRRGEDLAEALREDGKPASGDVSVFLRAHHLPDGLTLVGSDLLRSGLWTRGDVVECALFITSPRVISRRREAEEAERCPQRNRRSRAFHGAKNSAFLVAIGNTSSSKCDVAHSQQNDNQAQHGDELGVSCSESDHLLLQRTLRHRIDVECDDVFRRKTGPVPSCRSGDTVSKCELDVAGVVNEPLKSMVVTLAESLSFHSSMISADISGASPSRDVRGRPSGAGFPKSRLRCMMAEFRA